MTSPEGGRPGLQFFLKFVGKTFFRNTILGFTISLYCGFAVSAHGDAEKRALAPHSAVAANTALTQVPGVTVRNSSGFEVYTLELPGYGSFDIAPGIGSNAIQIWQQVNGRKKIPLLVDPPEDLTRLKGNPTNWGVPILWPFANRWVSGFQFQGRTILLPFIKKHLNTPIHGLVMNQKFTVLETGQNEEGVFIKTSLSTKDIQLDGFSQDDILEAFGDMTLELTHTMTRHGLKISPKVINHGNRDEATAFATHGWFRAEMTPGTLPETTVQIPARTVCLRDEGTKIPTGETRPVTDPEFEVLQGEHPLGPRETLFDHNFTDLIRDPEGRSTATVTYSERYRLSVQAGPAYENFVVLLQGKAFAEDRHKGQRSIPIEPQDKAANAPWQPSGPKIVPAGSDDAYQGYDVLFGLEPFPDVGQAKPLSIDPSVLSTLMQTDSGDGKVDESRIETLEALFENVTGAKPETLVKAPGRDNAQGEHVDYEQEQFKWGVHLFSLGNAIQNNFLAAARKRPDDVLRLVMAHEKGSEIFELRIDQLERLQERARYERMRNIPVSQRQIPVWANHTLGTLHVFLKEKPFRNGLDLLLTSNVPPGAGLSNSAANTLAVSLTLDNTFGLNLSAKDIIRLAREGEWDDFVGGQCGWLDQLIIYFAQKGKSVLIDYGLIETDFENAVKIVDSRLPPEFKRVLVDTGVPRELAVTEYGDRVEELSSVHRLIARLFGEEQYGSTKLTLADLNRLIQIFDERESPALFKQVVLDPDQIRDARLRDIAREMADIQNTHPLLPGDFAARKAEILERFDRLNFEPPSDPRTREILRRHQGKTPQESMALLLKRMRHQLTSGLRTRLSGEAAQAGDKETFGRLIDAEGKSLRMNGDYQITGQNGAQDALLDIGKRVGEALKIKVYGRMEGGGGGGNVGFYLDLEKPDAAVYAQWELQVRDQYLAWIQTRQELKNEKIQPMFRSSIPSEGMLLIKARDMKHSPVSASDPSA